MDHGDWVHEQLETLSRSHGFQYLPKEELENRLRRVRRGMADAGMEALLVLQKMDYCYLHEGLLRVRAVNYEAYKACREIHDRSLDGTRPGADCQSLFRDTRKLADKLGYKDMPIPWKRG